jgi:hypothetical protein|tara:strand:+ start:349 stop:606 length:258 start_codon:yes stop_codon:yes gene_type:complete
MLGLLDGLFGCEGSGQLIVNVKAGLVVIVKPFDYVVPIKLIAVLGYAVYDEDPPQALHLLGLAVAAIPCSYAPIVIEAARREPII